MKKLPHIVLPKAHQHTLSFTSPAGGSSDRSVVPRDRRKHGTYLQSQFNRAWERAQSQRIVTVQAKEGVYLEFVSEPGRELWLKSLENMRTKKVRLLNVREEVDADETSKMFATVYIANDEKSYFLRKITQYLEENTPSGKPKNQPFISRIADIQNALFRSFWTDDPGVAPKNEKQWVEVWLRADTDQELALFERTLTKLDISFSTGVLRFPERFVKMVFANQSDLLKLINTSDLIAEYRLAKTTARFFMEIERMEQREWLEDLLQRIKKDKKTNSAVCILDTGVNRGHPLLEDFLATSDCHSVDANWGNDDRHGHGTLMAGTVLYGDLTPLLSNNSTVYIPHLLESVKILPNQDENKPELWGYITEKAVSLAEIQAPLRKRTFCMAIAASDTIDRGRPSSWSAALDQLAARSGKQRLFIVCAGNSVVSSELNKIAKNYPYLQKSKSVHDPAQAWNVLTVGAMTNLHQITDPDLAGYKPVAPAQSLSPFSTTSLQWEDNKWPIKPELVLEGGNLAVDNHGFATECDDLSILSTTYQPHKQGYFYPFNMTSAATAQLAKKAAAVRAKYPDYWEETIRALLVHSAQWPEQLKAQFIDNDKKTNYQKLLRICGYGVPSLDRALYSAENSLTLVIQAEIQPFDKDKEGRLRTKEMHFYKLPWPIDILQSLPDHVEVKMKVTLSYFIEPGPGEIGWKDRYRYASHALRFEINNPNESEEKFLQRVNKQIRPQHYDSGQSLSSSDFWLLGSQARDKGSIHSDTWQGTSAQLAATNILVVTPVIGWWRERTNLNRWDSKTRYSLVVSIESESTEVDVYTPIANKIGIQVTTT